MLNNKHFLSKHSNLSISAVYYEIHLGLAFSKTDFKHN